MYDEPFADSSQIPTYLVSRFAREQVTVALTGDGGDELFAGYNRHFAAPRLWRQLRQRAAAAARRDRGRAAVAGAAARSGAALGMLPGRAAAAPRRARSRKACGSPARRGSFDDVYASFLDEWSQEQLAGARREGGERRRSTWTLGPSAPDAVRMMYCDAVSYLPDDILCKVDRASMAVSLETRVPFLDHRVAELAARIPLDMKISGGAGQADPPQAALRPSARASCSSGPRPASRFRSANGSRDRCGPGPRICSIPARWRAEGWFDPDDRPAPLARPSQRPPRFHARVVGNADVPGVASRRKRGGGAGGIGPTWPCRSSSAHQTIRKSCPTSPADRHQEQKRDCTWPLSTCDGRQ